MSKHIIQIGGVKCSLCGSEGTNKTTCPLNPNAPTPNPSRHPNANVTKQAKKTSPKKLVLVKKTVKPSSAPVIDMTQKKYPVVVHDPEDPPVTLVINKDEFLDAWVPIVQQYGPGKDQESPYDEKILGIPLFFAGDQWPELDNNPLSFYAQFYDPNPKSPLGKDFIQVYIRDLDEIEGGGKDAIIRKISQKDIGSKTPIDPPKVDTNLELNQKIIGGNGPSHAISNAGKIVGWNKVNTISWDSIFSKGDEFTQDAFSPELDKLNIMTGGSFGNLLQISGVPSSWQSSSDEYVKEGAYINELYNGYWGDAGSLHYTLSGHVLGDMA